MAHQSFSDFHSRRMHWFADITAQQWQAWLGSHPVDWAKVDGLLPVIVQDILTRQVLMQGFMNAEALEQSLASGKVTFFSRRKRGLWCKGETSGNFLQICELALDCDCDSLLILAQPCGPTCHAGSNSCYSTAAPASAPTALRHLGSDFAQAASGCSGESLGVGWLGALQRIIAERQSAAENPEQAFQNNSYVQHLFACGPQRMAQKVGEEGVEVALAAVALQHAIAMPEFEKNAAESLRQELAGEVGDLLFHLAILLQACDMKLQDAIDVLEQRHRQALNKHDASE